MELKEFVGVAGAPFIVLLVEIVKRVFPKLESRFYPIIALFWGEVINLALAYLLHTDYAKAAFVGLVATVIACGSFQYGKTQELKSNNVR